MTAVSVSALVKDYRSLFGAPHRALRGLTLAIPRGTAFGLIGPNGAGKTTFIKTLLGVVRPTSGDVSVLGGDPSELQVRARIGYLPERMHLPAALTARDFLRSMATLKGLKPTHAELAALLERVGLADSSQRVGTFSKGMRQRLGLAAAMLGRPELLILDEPTDGIDPLGRVEVRNLLLEEKARGATLLLNSHLLSETERVCDRIGVLQKGELKLEGSLDELTRAANRWSIALEGHSPRIYEGDVAGLNAMLDGVRREGLHLVSVTPQVRALEDVLADVEGAP